MKQVFFLAIFIFLIAPVFGAICSLDVTRIDNASFHYSLGNEGTVEAMHQFSLPYTKECMIELSIDQNALGSTLGNTEGNDISIEIQSDEFLCPAQFKKEMISLLPDELVDLDCFATFVNNNYLRVVLYGKQKLRGVSDSKKISYQLFSSRSFDTLASKSSVYISLPFRATEVSVNPKLVINTQSQILFPSLPLEPVIISFTPYDLESDFSSRVVPILIFVSIGVLILVILSFYLIRKAANANKVDKKVQLAHVRDKIKSLEQSFIRRQIDETTYRRLFEQYQLELNELVNQVREEENKKNPILAQQKKVDEIKKA